MTTGNCTLSGWHAEFLEWRCCGEKFGRILFDMFAEGQSADVRDPHREVMAWMQNRAVRERWSGRSYHPGRARRCPRKLRKPPRC